jgi:hypothetical protein
MTPAGVVIVPSLARRVALMSHDEFGGGPGLAGKHVEHGRAFWIPGVMGLGELGIALWWNGRVVPHAWDHCVRTWMDAHNGGSTGRYAIVTFPALEQVITFARDLTRGGYVSRTALIYAEGDRMFEHVALGLGGSETPEA